MYSSEPARAKQWTGVGAGLLFCALAFADPAAPGGPRIACDSASFNFGEVADQEQVNHTFVLKNAGDAELLISNVLTSCGCTTATLAKKNLAPGESVELEARFSLKGRTGRQEKTISVRSNDPVSPQFQLRMIGDIHRSIEVKPPTIGFGRIATGMGAEGKVRLSAMSGTVFRVTGIVTNGVAACDVRVDPVTEGSVYELTCTLRTNAVAAGGVISGRIVVGTDHPAYPKIEILVSGVMDRELIAIPAQLTLPMQDGPASPFTRYVMIRSGNRRAFEILDVKPPLDSIVAKVEKLPGVDSRIQLSNLAPSVELDGRDVEIRIRKWNGKEETLKVPMRISRAPKAGSEPAKP